MNQRQLTKQKTGDIWKFLMHFFFENIMTWNPLSLKNKNKKKFWSVIINPLRTIWLVLGPENDKMSWKVEIKTFPVVFGQNRWVHRVLRSILSPKVAAKFGIFDFFSDFLVIFGYSPALNVLIQVIFLNFFREVSHVIAMRLKYADRCVSKP